MRCFVGMVSICLGMVAGAQEIAITTSTINGEYTMSALPTISFDEGEAVDAAKSITVNPDTTYQSIVGFGSSLEHATCYNLSLAGDEGRDGVLKKLLDPEEGIGMDLMRICIGTSDFTGEPWYTYHDVEDGEADRQLTQFSIEKDRGYLLDTIKRALEINPELRYVASPWSPPAWMTTNNKLTAGRIDEDDFDALALYLLKFIRAYEAEGIPIYAITPQNEPDFPNPLYPTCMWKGEQQRDFVRDHLGPLFAKENVESLIWVWDHNYHLLDFPRAILGDADAAQYVDGTGFHLYEGEVTAMTTLQEEFPDKHIYFTEGSTFGVRGARTIIDIFRNWSRSYLAWVTVLDQNRKPNNGPHHASPTCIEYNTETGEFTYRFDYYMYGQFSKYIDRGSVRIESSDEEGFFRNVAFQTPDDDIVVVVANDRRSEEVFELNYGDVRAVVTVPGRSVSTLMWPANN